MSIEGLNELKRDWTLNNSLTIVDGTIEGDMNASGFIYTNVSVGTSGNNTWTGENTYVNHLPTYLLPGGNSNMNTREYTVGAVSTLGNNFLTSPLTFSGQNTFNVMPKVTDSTNVLSLNNKGSVDTKINTFSQLASNNTWTGNNYFDTFGNDLTTPNPTLDTHIANKDYVDTSIVNFNTTGGKVDLVEIATSGQHVVTCDPAIYSSMIICMVSGGGYGSPNLNVDFLGAISFGGSGAMICWKVPAFNGNASYEAIFNTRTSVGFSNFYMPASVITFTVFNGQNGNVNASGNGGTLGNRNTDIALDQYQFVNGSTQPRLLSTSVRRVSNICCWNGFGQGGSFDYVASPADPQRDILPTNNYCLLIKFRN